MLDAVGSGVNDRHRASCWQERVGGGVAPFIRCRLRDELECGVVRHSVQSPVRFRQDGELEPVPSPEKATFSLMPISSPVRRSLIKTPAWPKNLRLR